MTRKGSQLGEGGSHQPVFFFGKIGEMIQFDEGIFHIG